MSKKRLKDELNLIPDPYRKPPAWLKEDFPPKEDSITITFDGPSEIRTKVEPVRAKASDVPKARLIAFCDFLKMGRKPNEAARALHTTVREIMSHPDASKLVEKLVNEYTLTADQRKLAVRAAANKIMVSNLEEGGDPKMLLEAVKFIAEDPEVGIRGHNANPIQVDLTLRGIVSAPVEPLPGMPAQLPAPEVEEDIIDV